ncbi:hypothetical protein JB92DRAFT_2950242 [Gautieria morchelliformis]|nr:hypothetical protein JB92DRAFT_2950242 [Gautieria morchelliformis]
MVSLSLDFLMVALSLMLSGWAAPGLVPSATGVAVPVIDSTQPLKPEGKYLPYIHSIMLCPLPWFIKATRQKAHSRYDRFDI